MKKNMKYWRRWLAISAAAFPLALISAAASADVISVGFSTTGTYNFVGSCGASCVTVGLTGTTSLTGLDSYFGPSGTPDFLFTALLDATPVGPGIAASTPPTGGWQLQDSAGDSLFGSLNGFLAIGGGGAAGPLEFDVTGGTGLFDNISKGSGSSWAGADTNGFADEGILSLDTASGPSTVPEPGALLLAAAALAALGCWSAGKRRRALTASL